MRRESGYRNLGMTLTRKEPLSMRRVRVSRPSSISITYQAGYGPQKDTWRSEDLFRIGHTGHEWQCCDPGPASRRYASFHPSQQLLP